jgi:hypothetical protein
VNKVSERLDFTHHDHDQELGMYWYGDPLSQPVRPRDTTYWIETGGLVREYLRLQAGSAYSDTLRQSFVNWLRRSPAERRAYLEGDDMQRAELVERFLNEIHGFD